MRMSKEMGVSPRTIKYLENSEMGPSPGTLIAFRNMKDRVERREMMGSGSMGRVPR